jgi:hypothetical protein
MNAGSVPGSVPQVANPPKAPRAIPQYVAPWKNPNHPWHMDTWDIDGPDIYAGNKDSQ